MAPIDIGGHNGPPMASIAALAASRAVSKSSKSGAVAHDERVGNAVDEVFRRVDSEAQRRLDACQQFSPYADDVFCGRSEFDLAAKFVREVQ